MFPRTSRAMPLAGDARCGTLLAKVVFLATGVWWGVGLQLMVYAGLAADPTALLTNFTWYGGMLLGLARPRKKKLATHPRHLHINHRADGNALSYAWHRFQ